MKKLIALSAALLLAAVFAGPALAQAEDPVQIMGKSLRAFYYPGDDMQAKVTMELIAKDGGKRTRVMTMLRRDESEAGNQKYFIYFHEPGDVRRLTFMVWKYPAKEDDRWIFIPAVDLVKRIAAEDSRSSFVGSDFTYEDVSGRDVDADTHTFLRAEKLGDYDCWVVESKPKKPADYLRQVSWIDQKTSLPVKQEYYDAQGALFRAFTAEKIETIAAGDKSFPTVTKRVMANLKTGHRTEVVFSSIAYNVGLKDADFSERNMRQPPRAWIE